MGKAEETTRRHILPQTSLRGPHGAQRKAASALVPEENERADALLHEGAHVLHGWVRGLVAVAVDSVGVFVFVFVVVAAAATAKSLAGEVSLPLPTIFGEGGESAVDNARRTCHSRVQPSAFPCQPYAAAGSIGE